MPHMGVAPGEHLSSARQQNPQIQWLWVWWSNSNRHQRKSSPQSGRRWLLQYTVCRCMTANPPGPCSPWKPPSSVNPGLAWLCTGGSGQTCWSSRPSSGTWPVWEEFPRQRKACRRSCQHQCEEQRGHNLQSHSILLNFSLSTRFTVIKMNAASQSPSV